MSVDSLLSESLQRLPDKSGMRRKRHIRGRSPLPTSTKVPQPFNAHMREYLYIEQLAERTPWTNDAIRTMINRGIFKLGVHYFKPQGPKSRPIFSWEAVKIFIEGQRQEVESPSDAKPVRLRNGSVIKTDEAA